MNILTFIALSALACQADIQDTLSVDSCLDSSYVSSARVGERVPVAYSGIGDAELKAAAVSSSLPQILSALPSVVSVSECGTGIGYTSFSVRGISSYHTNVTLNGISLGDSESQQVFWVNIPALSSILSSVQLQRGLGTAACGPGAFGASLNMFTQSPSAYGGRLDAGYGSFGSGTISARAWSGIRKYGLFADLAFNLQHTDGFIRNAPADVSSVFANFGWTGKRDMVQAVFLRGRQKSAITWNGVPFDIYGKDRTFNVSEGDTDNFRQNHVQLSWRHSSRIPLKINTVLNFTHGSGWYDIDGNCDYLRNNLYVLRSDLSYMRGGLEISGTFYLSHFTGHHWGVAAGQSEAHYSDTARKGEADFSLRAEWAVVPTFSLFSEVQYRGVRYDLYSVRHNWNFCNPRLGASWSPQSSHKLYGFAAMGHREPARADFDSNPDVRSERLYDFELGYKYSSYVLSGSVNLYDMEYRDMLLETGTLDSQGYMIKDNIPSAHRRGVELSLSARPVDWLKLEANCTLSDNTHSGLPLLLSPYAVAAANLNLTPWKGFSLDWNFKYVGKQFYNNTGKAVSGETGSDIPAYIVSDVRLSQKFCFDFVSVTVSSWLNNVFDRIYFAYAYNYGVYPAAPRNGGVRVTLEF